MVRRFKNRHFGPKEEKKEERASGNIKPGVSGYLVLIVLNRPLRSYDGDRLWKHEPRSLSITGACRYVLAAVCFRADPSTPMPEEAYKETWTQDFEDISI